MRGDCTDDTRVHYLAPPGSPPGTQGAVVRCNIGPQWNADLTGSFKVTDFLTIYGNVLNFLDIKPKFDPMADYGFTNYNVIWGQPNIVGRYFRIGAKLDLAPRRYVAPLPPVALPPPPAPAAPATITCPDGLVILANQACPAPPPPPPPPAPTPERGL